MSFSEEKDTQRLKKPGRRQFLQSTALIVAGGASALLLSPLVAAQGPNPLTWNPPSNGSKDPYPIPWLDRNGSHNQSPGPGMEPSSIYHFKGQAARSNDFKGMGTDNKGNRIAFGAPSTDFSFLQGEYFAARSPQQGIFTHI
jgi:hypothetical protein